MIVRSNSLAQTAVQSCGVSRAPVKAAVLRAAWDERVVDRRGAALTGFGP